MTERQPDPKIIDLLNQDPEGSAHVSLEYFPPRTDQGVKVGAISCCARERHLHVDWLESCW